VSPNAQLCIAHVLVYKIFVISILCKCAPRDYAQLTLLFAAKLVSPDVEGGEARRGVAARDPRV
jgi:hypothetical protein